MITVSKTDLRYLKWNSTKAERKAEKDQLKRRAEYRERRDNLIEMIEKTVLHHDQNRYIKAPTVDLVLLALKNEVDRQPGGLYARRPYRECTGDSSKEQGERARFMKEAFSLAISRGRITLDRHSNGYLVRPTAVVHRNGKIIPEYMPTEADLTPYPVIDSDTEQELTLSGKFHALCRKWQQ